MKEKSQGAFAKDLRERVAAKSSEIRAENTVKRCWEFIVRELKLSMLTREERIAFGFKLAEDVLAEVSADFKDAKEKQAEGVLGRAVKRARLTGENLAAAVEVIAENDAENEQVLRLKLVVMGVANDMRKEAAERCDGDPADFMSKLAARLEQVAK